MSGDTFNSLSALPPERRWRAQTAPVPVAVALIRQAAAAGEELLLIRRANGPYTGQWALVGGKWDFGETLAEAIVRDGTAAEQQEGLVDWFGVEAIDALHAEGRIIPSDYAMIREFGGATRHSPYVEVEMRALLDGTAAQPSQMLRFRRHETPGESEI